MRNIFKILSQVFLNQTRKDFNIVIINDGSKYNSVDIIKKFYSENDNIRFIQHPDEKNHRLCASIRRAVEYASGEYIAFCESDDFWDERHVELSLKELESRTPDIVFNDIVTINNSHNTDYDEYVNWSNSFLKEHSCENIFNFLYGNPMPTFSLAA